MSTTTNIALNEPTYNSTSPTWDQPLNYNATILDQVFGNTTSVSVNTGGSTTYTNIAAPSATAAGSTSQAMRFNLTGALAANQNVLLPQGVAGMWVVTNGTSGAYTVTLGSNNGSNAAAGTTVAAPQGYSIIVYCDGTNVKKADDGILSSVSTLTIGSGTTGTIIQPYTGGGYGAIYSTNVTPSNSNFVLAYQGATTVLNATTNLQLAVADSIIMGISASGAALTGDFTATGNITAYYSDDRLKTRLGNIEKPLEKLKSLEGFYYEANETAKSLGYKVVREIGVSAQSVQAVLPEIVAPAPVDEQYLTVRYERLVPLLIEAIKELTAKVERLEGGL